MTMAEDSREPAPPVSSAARGAFSRGGHGWYLAVGAIVLLASGIALGAVLAGAPRPGGSTREPMTEASMAGPGALGQGDVAAVLEQGRRAFAKREFPDAINAFKRVLAAQPSHPEAHAYMGLILMEAGHTDGALRAFEQALAEAPELPMALWGKGMTLYQGRQDHAGARPILEKVLPLMPAGADRDEVTRVLAEISAGGRQPSPAGTPTAARPASTSERISGRITIAPALQRRLDGHAALFIIVRRGAGPPLAVKKIERPAFPLAYSLGQEDVMLPAESFTGKVTVTARLDKDGDATTRGPEDLTGDHRQSPVPVGATRVDIVIDRLLQ
jgi:cytochrome c-type biogenesis protein CcmH